MLFWLTDANCPDSRHRPATTKDPAVAHPAIDLDTMLPSAIGTEMDQYSDRSLGPDLFLSETVLALLAPGEQTCPGLLEDP